MNGMERKRTASYTYIWKGEGREEKGLYIISTSMVRRYSYSTVQYIYKYMHVLVILGWLRIFASCCTMLKSHLRIHFSVCVLFCVLFLLMALRRYLSTACLLSQFSTV